MTKALEKCNEHKVELTITGTGFLSAGAIIYLFDELIKQDCSLGGFTGCLSMAGLSALAGSCVGLWLHSFVKHYIASETEDSKLLILYHRLKILGVLSTAVSSLAAGTAVALSVDDTDEDDHTQRLQKISLGLTSGLLTSLPGFYTFFKNSKCCRPKESEQSTNIQQPLLTSGVTPKK